MDVLVPPVLPPQDVAVQGIRTEEVGGGTASPPVNGTGAAAAAVGDSRERDSLAAVGPLV